MSEMQTASSLSLISHTKALRASFSKVLALLNSAE